MRVAIYARVSTQSQAQSQTIEQQLQRLRDRVEELGWELPEDLVFRDDGISGASLNRPGLDRLRDKVANGELDCVMITNPDRLARNYIHQALLLEEFKKYDCQVEFLDRPMSSDPHDQLVLQIRGAVAEYERTLIRDRMRRGRLARYRAGSLLPWNRPPYGYQTNPDHPRDPNGVTIREDQAAVVRTIFILYTEESFSLFQVSKALHTADIPSPTGKEYWNTASIRNVLTNPAYIGQVFAFRSQPTRACKRGSALRPVGKRDMISRHVPEENWLLVATIPPIISQEQFELVKTRIAYNKQVARRHNTTHSYLLRGLVSCGYCRMSCTGRLAGKGYQYYMCRRKLPALYNCGLSRCTARFFRTDKLDQLVWQDLCELITHPDLISNAFESVQQSSCLSQSLSAQLENLRKRRSALQNHLERLTEAYLAGVIPLPEYQRRRAEIEKSIESLNEQEKKLSAQHYRHQELIDLFSSVTQFCQSIQTGLEAASFDQKRSLVELLIDQVVLFDEQIEIRYVIPLSQRSESVRFCHLRKDYFRDFRDHV